MRGCEHSPDGLKQAKKKREGLGMGLLQKSGKHEWVRKDHKSEPGLLKNRFWGPPLQNSYKIPQLENPKSPDTKQLILTNFEWGPKSAIGKSHLCVGWPNPGLSLVWSRNCTPCCPLLAGNLGSP